jgi:hypothetical protein
MVVRPEGTLGMMMDGGYNVHGAPKPTVINHIVVDVDNESRK